MEANHMVQRLAPLSIESVGSAKFLEQHDWVQKLNLQVRAQAGFVRPCKLL